MRDWAALWKVPGLARTVTVEFSPRLHRSWARVRLEARAISLNPELAHGSKRLLQEVLCHELAHVAVEERRTRTGARHGRDWAALIHAAGFVPARKLGPPLPASARKTASALYEHWCPVCQMTRMARRPVTRWRCAGCVEAGLDGALRIRKVERPRGRDG